MINLIEKIKNKGNEHYGDVVFVGIKYQNNVGWIAKIKRSDGPSITGMSTTSGEKALKRLSKRLNKIIDRYNMV